MTLITFKRWCVDLNGRTPVSVDPKRIDCVEHFCDARQPRWDGDDDSIYPMAAATRIIMKGKQEYLVEGTHAEVVRQLNSTKE